MDLHDILLLALGMLMTSIVVCVILTELFL